MKLSKITTGFGLFIIISASFMKQLWDFFNKSFGQNNVKIVFILLFFSAAISLAIFIFRSRGGFLKILGSLVVLCAAFIFLYRLKIFVEKIHVLEYGFLGWLAMGDLNKGRRPVINVLLAFLFVLTVGALDEGFQKFLPYRVAETRDIATNIISGIFGIALFLLR